MEIMVKSEDAEIEFIDGEYVIRMASQQKSVFISSLSHSIFLSLSTFHDI